MSSELPLRATRAPKRLPDQNEPVLRGRDAVLNAAALAFMERGYVATSIDDIAAVVGATKGRVYHYYRSKSVLFFDVVEFAHDHFDQAVQPCFESRSPADAKLRRMAQEHVLCVMKNFPSCKVAVQGSLDNSFLLAMAAEQPRALQRMMQWRRRYEAMFVKVLASGKAAGLFKIEEPELAAKAIFGALNWTTMWFDPQRGTKPDRMAAIADRLAAFVVAGATG